MNTRDQQTKEAWRKWINAHAWNVFGTLNFTPNKKPGTDAAQAAWRTLWNRVDRAAYGRGNLRVERMVFTQHGANDDNPHIHFLAKAPIHPAQFCISLNSIWASLDTTTAPPASNEILPIISKTRSAGYALHDLWRVDSETFNHEISHLNPPGITPHPDAAVRLTNQADSIWLSQAKSAYPKQLQIAQARFTYIEQMAIARARFNRLQS